MIHAILTYPRIDPVLIHIYGPISIRWYALSYIAGLLFGCWWFGPAVERELGTKGWDRQDRNAEWREPRDIECDR